MDDEQIVNLYWARDEDAIRETSVKYGRLCTYIANNILTSKEDCEECVNDTYYAVWNAIPDKKPNRFSAFIGKITRNLALKKYEYVNATKRSPSVIISLEELNDCVSGTYSVESELEGRAVENAIDEFLWQQADYKRNIFIRRYWYFDSIDSICARTGFSQSKTKSILYEMRQKLRKHLESEGINI